MFAVVLAAVGGGVVIVVIVVGVEVEVMKIGTWCIFGFGLDAAIEVTEVRRRAVIIVRWCILLDILAALYLVLS